MTWYRRERKNAGNMAAGMTSVSFDRIGPNVRGEAAVRDRKLYVEGTASLCLAFDQWKFGDELIAQVWAPKDAFRVEPRRSDAWTRVQVYFGTADLNTAAALEAIAAEIRKRVRALELARGDSAPSEARPAPEVSPARGAGAGGADPGAPAPAGGPAWGKPWDSRPGSAG